MRKRLAVIWALVVLSFVIGLIFYSSMPEKMATHWNYKWEANGYSSKIVGLFLLPLIILIMTLVLLGLPLIFPLRENLEKIRKHYDNFIILFITFIIVVYLAVIFWNLGYKNDLKWIFPLCFGGLFFYIGKVLEKSKRNWIIGIRTPWTLSSDRVWEKTHKLAGKLFEVSGVISAFGIFFGNYGFVFILVPVVISSIFSVVYSYFVYREETVKIAKKRRK